MGWNVRRLHRGGGHRLGIKWLKWFASERVADQGPLGWTPGQTLGRREFPFGLSSLAETDSCPEASDLEQHVRVGCGVGTPLIPGRMVESGLSACHFLSPSPPLFLSPAVSIFALLSLCPGSFHNVLVLLFLRNNSATLTRPMHSSFRSHFLDALWSIVGTLMFGQPKCSRSHRSTALIVEIQKP